MNTANSQYISLKMNIDFIGKCSTTAKFKQALNDIYQKRRFYTN